MRLSTHPLRRPAGLGLAAGLCAAVVAPTAPATAAGAAPKAAPAAATEKRESVVTLTVEPLWSGIGESLVLTGEVFDGGTYRALTGRPISVQSRLAGTTTWTTVARLESNDNGAFRLERTADRSRDYRAVYSGNSWYDSDQSNWERQVAKDGALVRLSARLDRTSTGSAVRGRATKMWSSTLRPIKAANIYIQSRQPYSSSWVNTGRVLTNSEGYYSFRTTVPESACYRYRAIYKGNTTWAAKSTTTYWSTCS